MSKFREQIPGLIDRIKIIFPGYQSSDGYCLGLTVTYLTYLYDLLEKEEVERIKERMVSYTGNGQYCKTFKESAEDDPNTFDPYEVYDGICDDIAKVVENRMKNLTSDEKYVVIEKLSEQFRFWNVLGD